MFLRFPTARVTLRGFAPYLAVLIASGALVSCEKIKSKLERLANANTSKPAPPPKPEEAPLTPEEEAMNKTLQDPALFSDATSEEPAPKAVAFELNKSALVSVLGYHDFKERGGAPMLIAAPKFRAQMQAIKDSKIPVIPLRDLVAWKKGEKNIPEETIVITMDDGWEGVYLHAFPILKEFGFPFTVYLYKKYVNTGGRSMTWEQIREMMAFGAEVGSHSVSHDSLTGRHGKTEAEQNLWLLTELKESKEFLEKNLGVPVTSFAYPYGNVNDVVVDTTLQVGYESGVTVSPQKVTWETHMGRISRYIIHGDSDGNFKLATSFRGRGELGNSRFMLADAKDAAGNSLVDLKPAPDQVITDRRPTIEADLTRLGPLVPESVKLRVGGLGTVPAVFDPVISRIRYQLPYRLRREECYVTLSFKRDATQPEEVVSWKFKVNLAAAYLPKNDETPLADPIVIPAAVPK